MELNCTDDLALVPSRDVQDPEPCPSSNTMSEITKGDAAEVFAASKDQTILISQPENVTTSFDMPEGFLLCTPAADLIQWDCCDLLLGGVNASAAAPESEASAAETGLSRSLSHPSNDSDSDVTSARLPDLYIFESETHDFIPGPEANPRDIKCPQPTPSSQTVADDSFRTHQASDSSRAVNKYDQDVSDNQIVPSDSQRSSPPAADAWDLTQANAEGLTKRNDSPELWVDACQDFAFDDQEDRNVSVRSVMQEVSTSASDFPAPSQETQRSGYGRNACDTIGWSLDDKSWGPPVERWSSVDSWESALSDWADIIASPPEDLTAAFTEIGAEIDALTQALAEVTTQIEADLQSEKAEEASDEAVMGIQDTPLDAQNIAEASVSTGQERDGVKPSCTRGMELETKHSRHPGPQEQSTSLCEVTASDTSVLFSDLLDRSFDSSESDVVLNIVEDTDCDYKTHLLSELDGDNECDVKHEGGFSSSDLVVERDIGRICAPPETLNVTHQRNKELGLPFSNTLPPEASSEPGLNAHVLPDTLADFDGACQVEPLWGSPKFITPLAPLSVGSSLVTQAPGSSLNGDQEATRWILNRDSVYDPSEALDFQTESDEVTDFSSESPDFSSESAEDTAWPKHTDTDHSPDLKAGEVQFFTESKSIYEESRELLNAIVIPNDHFIVCEEKQIACFTLDLYDPFAPLVPPSPAEKMPHKTHKSSSEGKTRSKKERPAGQPHGGHTSRKQENLNNVEAEQKPHAFKENLPSEQENRLDHSEPVKEPGVAPQGRRHSKKKKKHLGKNTSELLTEAESEVKTEPARAEILKEKGIDQSGALKTNTEKPDTKTVPKDKPALNASAPNNKDDIIKKRRLSQDKFGKLVSALESKLTKGDTSKRADDKADVVTTRRKAYSEVVKQKIVKPADPKVVQPIQAASVSGDPQSLCLWCQFSDVLTDCTVTWRKDRTALSEIKRSAGDESRISLTISNASQKDLGKYQCELKSAHKTITLDFVLTYELLSEIVLPTTPKTTPAALVELEHEEESVNCSRLMFKEDFLVEQYFGESHSASIVTEKTHFGEGMHRRAFRTTLQAGQVPLLVPGHSCVLKVHNAISYGTKNNDELVQKNFNLAVEECQVQNTAREYIKAYTSVAQSFDAFGPVPEIIPIYLVHRPSNDIPYATLEEELIGDFVKYSVKDGKEINLLRKDSEAGQKCCAFQHWVYHHTDGNLLVTDMQGVGMRLTDVGIATCKKGYKGFKGNCATSFIDQFKVLHQCNSYCEILGLKSLQPKPKKTVPAPKPKPQLGATPKKKLFEPAVKGKS